MTSCDALEVVRSDLFEGEVVTSSNWTPKHSLDLEAQGPIGSLLTDRHYLLKQPQYKLEVNYSIPVSDG